MWGGGDAPRSTNASGLTTCEAPPVPLEEKVDGGGTASAVPVEATDALMEGVTKRWCRGAPSLSVLALDGGGASCPELLREPRRIFPRAGRAEWLWRRAGRAERGEGVAVALKSLGRSVD